MGEKIIKNITRPYLLGAIILAVITIGTFIYFNWKVALGASILYLLYILLLFVLARFQANGIYKILENVEEDIEETVRYTTKNNPLPLCIVDENGRIILTNDKFKKIFPGTQILKTEIYHLIGKSREDLKPDKENNKIYLDGKVYHILPAYLNDDMTKSAILYFLDETGYENLQDRFVKEKKCIMHILVDNFDEIIGKSPDDRKSVIATNIEGVIRQYAKDLEASVTKYRDNRYILVFDNKYYNEIKKEKFAILDSVRDIETDADFPVSLSIGIGIAGDNMQERDDDALFALDLAQGRGGDQAVVKAGEKVTYYGGKLQIIETRNKGKSRVMAHALRKLIDDSSQVLVMGHKNPDADSLGSAVGVSRIVKNRGKNAYIIMNSINHSMKEIYEMAKDQGGHAFINSEKAFALIKPGTLLIIVDVHKPSLVESQEIISKADQLVLIDHHRKGEEFIDNATLTFMEPSASSTSELIVEILQYMPGKKPISKSEAELLIAGIMVDTNSFSVKTGARTFEAASWLRMNGADTTFVRQLLQNDMEDFKQRAHIIANAEFMDEGIAIATSRESNENVQIVVAQAADELMNIKGIKASFVIGKDNGKSIISARSLGGLNVQILMEKFGGGGHLTMAAAQVDMEIDEVVAKIKKYIRKSEGSK